MDNNKLEKLKSVGNAKLIFENSRELDALDMILQSNRVDNKIRDLARKLRR